VFKEQLPSGRWRAGFRLAGRKIAQTFDYEYEAVAWALEAERLAAAAASSAHTPAVLHAPLAAAPAVVVAAAPAGPTIAAHAQEWLARRRGDWEAQTVTNYRSIVRQLTASNLGPMRVDAVTRADIDRWRAAALDAGTGRTALNSRLKVIKLVLTDAADNHLATGNVAARIPLLKVDAGPDRTLDRDEEAAVIDAAPAELVAPILTGLDAGLRWQEVYALTPAAVLPGGFLMVSRAVIAGRGEGGKTGTIKPWTKGGGSRTVPVATDRLAAALDEAVAAARAAGRGRDGLLFPGRRGAVMRYQTYRRALWLPTMTASGIESPPGFHGLRHTYGSRLAAAGVPRSEIAKLMGHADEATTKRYIHAGDDGRRATLARDALAIGLVEGATRRRLRSA
jgi:integrase